MYTELVYQIATLLPDTGLGEAKYFFAKVARKGVCGSGIALQKLIINDGIINCLNFVPFFHNLLNTVK
jgi:hypothetical protein